MTYCKLYKAAAIRDQTWTSQHQSSKINGLNILLRTVLPEQSEAPGDGQPGEYPHRCREFSARVVKRRLLHHGTVNDMLGEYLRRC